MTIKLPTMLAFERKLETSDALMTAGNWEYLTQKESPWLPIKITKRQNRSTQSAFGTSDENKTKPNPVSSDSDDANLPHDKDTLKVSFTLRVIGNLGEPFGCNDPTFEKAIKEKVTEFKEEGLKELSHRYAQNIASGRFLWRNRVCANNISTQVRINDSDLPISFDGYEFPLNDFDVQRDDDLLKKLADAIFQGLESTNNFACLHIDAYVQLGNGQHIFPSQEMNMGEKKKVLFKLDDCAALHSVKIGNAIRTIDDWYDDAECPIAVEPFGSVTQRGQAYRKSKTDLYTLMLAWVNNKDVSQEQKNFVLANFIRGGVFGGKSE
jgi:CRISPR-associated protein Csy3